MWNCSDVRGKPDSNCPEQYCLHSSNDCCCEGRPKCPKGFCVGLKSIWGHRFDLLSM